MQRCLIPPVQPQSRSKRAIQKIFFSIILPSGNHYFDKSNITNPDLILILGVASLQVDH
jgi:hypothetical protein